MVRNGIRTGASRSAARLVQVNVEVYTKGDQPAEQVYHAVQSCLSERTRLQEEFLIRQRECRHSKQSVECYFIAEEIQ
jgi:hypothetical protein